MKTLIKFFTRVLPEDEGWVPIMTLGPNGGLTRCQWFHWPSETEKMCEYVASKANQDVYWSPMLFHKPSTLSSARHAAKRNVKSLACVYADLDGLEPEALHIEPTVLVKSSPEHYHAYWRLSDYKDLENLDIEQLNRGVYQEHADNGVDRGWPLAKKLRVPGTMNTKPAYGLPVPVSASFNENTESYSSEQFSESYAPATTPKVELIAEMPDTSMDDAIVILTRVNDSRVTDLFSDIPSLADDWSSLMYSLECYLFEAGLELAEVFTVLRSAECNKFRRDDRPDSDLWIQLQRDKARWDDDQITKMELADSFALEHLRGEEVVRHLPGLKDEQKGLFWSNVHLIDAADDVPEDTVVDALADYMQHLSKRTSTQFNYAASLSVLAAVLGSEIRIRTGFGVLGCNLFTLILGRTTEDKKSTTASYAKHFLRRLSKEFETEFLGPEDHTPEALAQYCGTRPNSSVLVVMDEIQDMFARAMRSGSYMDGEVGFLTKCYDGYVPSQARKQKGNEYRPETPFSLSILGLGIMDQVAGNLKTEKIKSGFIPRCLIVLPEPKADRPEELMDDIRILSNEDDEELQAQDRMFSMCLQKLMQAKYHWRKERESLELYTVAGEDSRVLMNFSEAALERIKIAGNKCAVLAANHPLYSEYLNPCVERLGLSMLRMAALLAATEMSHRVELRHAVKVIRLAEFYFKSLEVFVVSAADSSVSKDITEIESLLEKQPEKKMRREDVENRLLRKFDTPKRVGETIRAGQDSGRLQELFVNLDGTPYTEADRKAKRPMQRLLTLGR